MYAPKAPQNRISLPPLTPDSDSDHTAKVVAENTFNNTSDDNSNRTFLSISDLLSNTTTKNTHNDVPNHTLNEQSNNISNDIFNGPSNDILNNITAEDHAYLCYNYNYAALASTAMVEDRWVRVRTFDRSRLGNDQPPAQSSRSAPLDELMRVGPEFGAVRETIGLRVGITPLAAHLERPFFWGKGLDAGQRSRAHIKRMDGFERAAWKQKCLAELAALPASEQSVSVVAGWNVKVKQLHFRLLCNRGSDGVYDSQLIPSEEVFFAPEFRDDRMQTFLKRKAASLALVKNALNQARLAANTIGEPAVVADDQDVKVNNYLQQGGGPDGVEIGSEAIDFLPNLPSLNPQKSPLSAMQDGDLAGDSMDRSIEFIKAMVPGATCLKVPAPRSSSFLRRSVRPRAPKMSRDAVQKMPLRIRASRGRRKNGKGGKGNRGRPRGGSIATVPLLFETANSTSKIQSDTMLVDDEERIEGEASEAEAEEPQVEDSEDTEKAEEVLIHISSKSIGKISITNSSSKKTNFRITLD
ncbi:hypothetical protein BT63DRAFT_203765 [Microthyrium microscopicum]|uniref:Uncharacterized protein n=1 Tax=Microthyrium microscopicum TaxID=703497 RepID=A0A6A6UF44_9PEZI|nr:hypothetical protein BT63DRAFT_203765 [Microthyrium microscopicum]